MSVACCCDINVPQKLYKCIQFTWWSVFVDLREVEQSCYSFNCQTNVLPTQLCLCLWQDLRNSGRIGGYMQWMGQVTLPLSWRSFLHPSLKSSTTSALVKHSFYKRLVVFNFLISLSHSFCLFHFFSVVTYLVCTQMRVCQEAGRFVYLTSSTETQLFITGKFQSEHDNSRTKTTVVIL